MSQGGGSLCPSCTRMCSGRRRLCTLRKCMCMCWECPGTHQECPVAHWEQVCTCWRGEQTAVSIAGRIGSATSELQCCSTHVPLFPHCWSQDRHWNSPHLVQSLSCHPFMLKWMLNPCPVLHAICMRYSYTISHGVARQLIHLRHPPFTSIQGFPESNKL